jgi:hypothetical protein
VHGKLSSKECEGGKSPNGHKAQQRGAKKLCAMGIIIKSLGILPQDTKGAADFFFNNRRVKCAG